MADTGFGEAYAAHRAGDVVRAERLYKRILKKTPAHVDTLAMLARLHEQAGRHSYAVQLIDRALALAPRNADLHGHRATMLVACNRHDAAVEAFRAALTLAPTASALAGQLAKTLRLLGRVEEAEQTLRSALGRAPDDGGLLAMLVQLLTDLGRPIDGETLDVGTAAALSTLGHRFLHRDHRVREAAALFRRAIIVAENQTPRSSVECGNAQRLLGHACAALGQSREAIAAFEAAEALFREIHRASPERVLDWWQLISLLLETGRPADAITFADEALRRMPEARWLHVIRGWSMVAAGDELAGFLEEAKGRFVTPGAFNGRAHPAPIWDGRAVPGGTVLVTSDDGLGDFIQGCRFVPRAAERARITLQVPAELMRLAATIPGPERIVAMDEWPAPADFRCPVTHLCAALAPSLTAIPADVPYLGAAPEQTATWKARLAGLPGLRVGLAWQGNPNLNWDFARSIAVEQLAILADVSGVSFISLQARATAPDWMYDAMATIGDLADTAALLACLDLVVSVDSAVAHLAGALARPVWLLNRFSAEARWGVDRTDSVWYPTLTQFRQTRPGDWDGVVRRVRDALRTWRDARDPHPTP